MLKKITYAAAGVNIDTAEATKKDMAKNLETGNPLVLNKIGAFSSLCDASFPGYKHPVLVCKTEEPGSKQLLAFKHKRIKGICFDLINHLINDVIVMGATPLFIQDLIVCGKLEKDVVGELVKHMAEACKAQGCALTGGETSEQPNVLAAGTYVLGASCIGVAEKTKIIDGSAIREGDIVLAIESSGPHTNGYTLIRALIDQDNTILDAEIADRGKNPAPKKFLDLIMEPHRCYFKALKDLFKNPGLHGMAHITGGGIQGNLNRILPAGLDAVVDASKIKVLPVFWFIREKSGNDDNDMMRTFNLGVGMTLVVSPKDVNNFIVHMKKHDLACYEIGTIVIGGSQSVRIEGKLKW
ncbi:phosphoribosylformylglycinamidine cyclo-ligase [Candidatus Peribacteria bacterium]|nr:phosphoribosylformylglycinamidine cyclo-ligase [Candidatus Peribacteria bacterium]